MSTNVLETETKGGSNGPNNPSETAERNDDWDEAGRQAYIAEGIKRAVEFAETHATKKIGGVALTVVEVDRVPDGNLLEQLLGRRRRMAPFAGPIITSKYSPLPQHN